MNKDSESMGTIRRNRGDWIQTFTGRQFFINDPQPGDIHIEDIAHALAMQCRFTGHTRHFYSVAQHSVLASQLVPLEERAWGLMHDASEAYLCDVARPVKPHLTNYKALEASILKIIAARFSLPWPMPASIEQADLVLLKTERRDLLNPGTHRWEEQVEQAPALPIRIIPWTPEISAEQFLDRFAELKIRHY